MQKIILACRLSSRMAKHQITMYAKFSRYYEKSENDTISVRFESSRAHKKSTLSGASLVAERRGLRFFLKLYPLKFLRRAPRLLALPLLTQKLYRLR